MARVRHLAQAPITEALIDIRAVLPDSFSSASFEEARPQFASLYPIVEERRVSEMQLEVKHGAPPAATTRQLGLQGVFFKSADEKSIVQFRLDGFTFNRLRPYTTWDDILPEALRSWEIYRQLAHPTSVPRVAVRYINHLPLGPQAPDLSPYIVTGPCLPDDVPGRYNGFTSRIVLEDDRLGVSAIVGQALEVGVRSDVYTLLLDIDAYVVGDLSGDPGSLTETLNRLRAYKNKIFFGTLREEFAASFER